MLERSLTRSTLHHTRVSLTRTHPRLPDANTLHESLAIVAWTRTCRHDRGANKASGVQVGAVAGFQFMVLPLRASDILGVGILSSSRGCKTHSSTLHDAEHTLDCYTTVTQPLRNRYTTVSAFAVHR